MVRRVVVVPHDPNWSRLFEQEAGWLQELFGAEIVAIHHFGSTTILDIHAKPIVDILVEVRNIEHIDAASELMRVLGYIPKGEFGIPGRRFFIKGDEENRTHHVHFYQAGHPEVARHLDFRDFLITHPSVAESYSQLKIELARRFPADIDGYNTGKTGFILEVDEMAKAWQEQQPYRQIKPQVSAFKQIVAYKNRRDETLNRKLAQVLADKDDSAAIQEIAANLWNPDPAIQSDCIKVLYETGALKPELVAEYWAEFLKLLDSKNNRLVWGGMTALATIARLEAENIYHARSLIIRALKNGSVITADNAVKVLAGIACAKESYRAEIFPILLNHLEICRSKEVAQYAESTLTAVSPTNCDSFCTVLESRLPELRDSQAARVKKAIKSARKVL